MSSLQDKLDLGGVYIIAELSANHGHDLDIVIKTIDAVKRSGANAIKLQTFTPDSMTLDISDEDFMANPNGPWAGRKLYDLYKEAALPWEWHKEIFEYSNNLGLDCLSSPFDIAAVDFLEQFSPPAYKIASFEITDIPLITYTASKMKPIIISTGVATDEDILLAIKACREVGNKDITVLKCTSQYPTKPEDANLIMIQDIADRFNVKVGLSDHTLGNESAIMSVALGARVIEKHFILDKSIGGPDAGFSLDENEFTKMVSSVRQAELLYGKVEYSLSDKLKQSRSKARSLYITEDVKEGERVSSENIKSIRPGKGLHPRHWNEVINKSFNNDFKKGTPLSFDLLS